MTVGSKHVVKDQMVLYWMSIGVWFEASLFSLDGESKQSLIDHEPSLRKVSKTHGYYIHVCLVGNNKQQQTAFYPEIHTWGKRVLSFTLNIYPAGLMANWPAHSGGLSACLKDFEFVPLVFMPFLWCGVQMANLSPSHMFFNSFVEFTKNWRYPFKTINLKSLSLPFVGALSVWSVAGANRWSVPHTSCPWGLELSLAFVLAFRTRSLGNSCGGLGLPFSSSLVPVP